MFFTQTGFSKEHDSHKTKVSFKKSFEVLGKIGKKSAAFIIAGLCLILASVIMTAVLNIPTSHEEKVSFSSTYGDDPVMLKGSYYPAETAKYAVLMCPGYSCDRQKLRPFANIFASNGMTVMTFDYSGQASSPGKIGFDNAKNDKITKEIADAAIFLHEKSGIAYENIILIGHSMGGRALVRFMYDLNRKDSGTLIPEERIAELSEIRNIILISPEVNYEHSAQASLFAGTSDADTEPWAGFNQDYVKGFNTFLFGSTADDVVSSYDVLELFRRFGGNPGIDDGCIDVITQTNGNGDRVTVGVTPGILHSYQWYSPEFAEYINYSVESIVNSDREAAKPGSGTYTSPYPAGRLLLVYAGYFTALAGCFLSLCGLGSAVAGAPLTCGILIKDEKKWLLRKLLLWLPGIVLAFVICCIAVCMPFGSPVMNIPYMCFIAGYGIVCCIVYAKGRMKGTEGRLPKPSLAVRGGIRFAAVTALAVCGYAALVVYITRASMYRLIPLNIRLFWLLFCSVLMTAGYYVSGVEADMLADSGAGRGTVLVYNLIQYSALFLFVLFYLVIRSYSGVIQQAVNLVLMYLLVIPLGEFVKKMTGNRLCSAAVSAVFFQSFMITSAAIISFF